MSDPMNTTTPPANIVQNSGEFLCKWSRPSLGGCQEKGSEICAVCKCAYCQGHASPLDPAFCLDCLKPEEAGITKEPLVSVDGVTHHGSHQIPTGNVFKPMAQRIAEMETPELQNHIERMKARVREAESVLDYRRIDLACSELEVEERKAEERRRTRGVKSDGLKNIITTGNVNGSQAGVASSNGNGSKAPAQTKQEKARQAMRDMAKVFGVELKTDEDYQKFVAIIQMSVKKK